MLQYLTRSCSVISYASDRLQPKALVVRILGKQHQHGNDAKQEAQEEPKRRVAPGVLRPECAKGTEQPYYSSRSAWAGILCSRVDTRISRLAIPCASC